MLKAIPAPVWCLLLLSLVTILAIAVAWDVRLAILLGGSYFLGVLTGVLGLAICMSYTE